MDPTLEEDLLLEKIKLLKELYHELDKLVLSKYAGPLYSGPAVDLLLQKYRKTKQLIAGGNT
jgi:hypothetical protein